ncbi:MAG TPA: benzoate-CoA ligase family protein [Acidimicrobiia bacterium]
MSDWPRILNADSFFLRDGLETKADRIALRLDDRTVTYGEVDRLASGYAAMLLDLGVGKGDRVLVLLDDAIDYPAVIFGVMRVGGVVVMLNPGLTPTTMSGINGMAKPGAVVVARRYVDGFRSAVGDDSPPLLVLEEGFTPPATDVPTQATAPEDPAVWLFSGGTTGLPKAVPQTHRSLVNTTRLYGQGALGLRPDDITIAVPKLYFGYATGSNLLFPFSVGASCVLFAEPSTAEAIFDRVEAHRATVLVNVPSAINQMVGHPDASKRDLSSLRFATSAGEALPETLYHRWVDTFGVELLDGLGTAEMWHIFVTNTLGEVKPGTLGKVVPGYEIKACDEDGNEVPPGEVGRLWVKGDSLGLGYWGDPERTAEAFRPPWFVGGDLVSIDEDGYVTHRGRADDAIKVKGKWFRPQELESVLLDHPAVASCAVVAVEDEAGLNRPVAFVVRSGEVGEQALIDWSLERLEAYKHPRRVFFVDRLPLTHLGKVDRGALKRQAMDWSPSPSASGEM